MAEGLIAQIVEVVVSFEETILLIVCAEVVCAFGAVVALVVAGYMVGDEVHYHLHACIVCTIYKGAELLAAGGNVLCKVGVGIVIVFNGIR